MKPDYPSLLKLVGLNFVLDEQKVKNLTIEVTEIDINELTWLMHVPFLWSRMSKNNLNPIQVILYPHAHEDEHARTRHADLTDPIDIMESGGKWVILNGLHRLMKAHMFKKPTVLVRKIPRSEIPNISL